MQSAAEQLLFDLLLQLETFKDFARTTNDMFDK